MSENSIIKAFAEWLKQSWYVFPETELLLKLIKSRYSMEEAEFLTGFPFRRTPLAELVELKGVEEQELLERLNELAKRGLIWKDFKKGSWRFGLHDLFFSIYRSAFWPGNDDTSSRATAPPANQYLLTGAMESFSMAEHKALRTLPVHETIHPNTTVKPYEDVVKLLDSFEYYTVSACPCRFRKQLDPEFEDSDKPLEVCLHFDALGHYIVDNGMGREITREETEQILKKAAAAGLVHGLSNWQDKPDTICNCDKEHCFMFESYYTLGHHKTLDRSNFEVSATDRDCKGCGLCVKRCPMEALKLVDFAGPDVSGKKKRNVCQADSEKCIGCGVCVVKCPTRSLVLKARKSHADPPQSVLDWTMRYLEDVGQGNKKLRSSHIQKPSGGNPA